MYTHALLKTGWVFTTASFDLLETVPPLRIKDLRCEKSSTKGPIRQVRLGPGQRRSLFDHRDLAGRRIVVQLHSVRNSRDLRDVLLSHQLIQVFWIPALVDVEELHRLV
jgi:hypothetical protein